MRRAPVFILSPIARGLCCLRDASTIFSLVALSAVVSLAGCSSGGQQGGSVQKSAQTITVTPPTSPVTYTPTLSIKLSATANSGLAVAYTVDSTSTSKGTISGNTVTGITAGKLVIDANQAGNSDYYAAAQVQVTIVVSQAVPIITLPTAGAITAGAALSTSPLTGGTATANGAAVSGKFVWADPTTVPAAGTDPESVTFTPTDATDYMVVVGSVNVVVNPATPQITGFSLGDASSLYAVEDTFNSGVFLPWTVTGTGFASGDTFSLAHQIVLPPGISDWGISSYTSTTISGIIEFDASDFTPQPLTATDANTNGSSNPYSGWFLGSASQSTLAIFATTGEQVQANQQNGQLYARTTDATAEITSSGGNAMQSPINIAIDNLTGDVVTAAKAINIVSVIVVTQSGADLCYFNAPSNVTLISSVAAMGGNIVATAPNENLVILASLTNCSGGQQIPYTTVSIPGQPWAVAMSGTDAYILSRDDAGNGFPRVTKISASSGAPEGFVDLTGIPTITSIRSTTPYEGIDQITAFNSTPVVSVLFVADPDHGTVLTISTNTANGAKMAVTYTKSAIPNLPVIMAVQEPVSGGGANNVTKPVLWIGNLPLNGSNVMNVDALDPATGDYTPNVGTCPAGLVGGFAASANGLQCAGVDTIGAPLALPYSTY